MLVPFAEVLADRHDVTLYGSRSLAELTPVAGRVTYRQSGPERFMPSRISMLAASIDDLRDHFASDRPDLVIRDSCERGSVVVAHEMGIPVITVPSRADYFTALSATLDDWTLAPFGLTRRVDTYGRNSVFAVGPGEMYGDNIRQQSHNFVSYFPPSDRHVDHRHFEPGRRRAVLSFGTFAGELHHDQITTLCSVLRHCGIEKILLKIRDEGLASAVRGSAPDVAIAHDVDILREVSEDAIFIGHGSLIGTMEALSRGAAVLIAPSESADHEFVASRCERLGVGQWLRTFDGTDLTAAVKALTNGECDASISRYLAKDRSCLTMDQFVEAVEGIWLR